MDASHGAKNEHDEQDERDVDCDDGREETAAERADRNWIDIVQELRVAQTGTQILAGFLLTAALQASFPRLETYQHVIYLTLVLLAAATTTVGLVPVSLHRGLFRHHQKPLLVRRANALLKAVLALISLLTAGVVLFLFDVTTGSLPLAIGAAALVALGMLGGLLVYPRVLGRTQAAPPPGSSENR